MTLLEEPQAAFYAWPGASGRGLAHAGRRRRRRAGRRRRRRHHRFPLIAVERTAARPRARRVGDHILLGGDNMDLALARTVQRQAGSARASRSSALAVPRAGARGAGGPRMRLFEDAGAGASAPIAVPSRGSSLFGGTISTRLDRATLRAGGARRLLRPHRGRRICRDEHAPRAACRSSACLMRPIPSVQQASRPLPHPQPAERAGQRGVRARSLAQRR